ncbi:glycosyltransferase family 4 protein [Methylolobus aquaticus]|nr:glycosyltransferase family 4 protein [Methylolobus aquaticus]
MATQSTPRVLLSAYQCGPGMGSVSQLGWQWYSRLARLVPVTLLTHVRNRTALVEAGAPLPDSEVLYVDTEWLAGPLYKVMSRLFPHSQHTVFLFSSVDYFVYDRAALRAVAARTAAGAWDIVHVPTPVSPMAATLLYRTGLPLVLGPWNGGLTNPENFPEILRAEAAWTYPLRNLGKLINAVRRSTRNASAILVANRSTRNAVPAGDRDRCRLMIENAVDTDVFRASGYPASPSPRQPLRLVFVGRLIPVKGVTMLLEAVQRFRSRQRVELTLVGDGPLASELHREVAERGLDDCVTFAGERSPNDVAELIGAAHLFVLPSVRESGGAVLLEAMACARPVAAIAYGGPAEIVDEDVGRAIPPEGRTPVVDELVKVFEEVTANPAQWAAKGRVGLERVRAHYTWDAKIKQALALYGELLHR